jgi:16S rRNA (adenine1518-N6/adenine1519-N6)-dimethyltransferase
VTVHPKKRLGQHFLVDRNILDVIGRLAELEPDDVVLEVGPGLGILTRYLADRVALVHAVELDRSLAAPLEEALAGADNVRITYGDALELEVETLDPPPAKLVANLPYAIATPLVLELLERAPRLRRFVVMVQREVADRFFADSGTKAYGAVSVLVRLQARKLGLHPVPPSVFRPRPRVESALVAFERVPAPDLSRVRRVVEAAFAHRRKTLANSVATAGLAPRAEAERALAAIGKPATARAEELEPGELVLLADALVPAGGPRGPA